MKYQPTLMCDGFIFPEAPRWHRGAFYCCSIDEGTIYRVSAGQKELVLKIDDWLSGWAFEAPNSDTIVLTSAKKRKLLRYDPIKNEMTELADLTDKVVFGINDLVRNHDGVVFVDSVQYVFGSVPPEQAPKSQLMRVAVDGTVSVASGLTHFPNGLVITPDYRTLLAADTLSNCIHQWDLDANSNLSDHRIFAHIPGTMPDGMCLDAEGGIWFASACQHKVYRVITGGEITDEVDMGDTYATACMLGGSDGKTLLITASDSHDRKVIYQHPSGRVFSVEVAVPGVGLPSWYE